MKTMSAPSSASIIFSVSSSRLPPFDRRQRPPGSLFADLEFDGCLRGFERLEISIGDKKLDSLYAGLDHSIDRIAASAADADDFNTGAAYGLFGLIKHNRPASDLPTLIHRHYSCLLLAIKLHMSDRASDALMRRCRSHKNLRSHFNRFLHTAGSSKSPAVAKLSPSSAWSQAAVL
jgi:hypothetical protein